MTSVELLALIRELYIRLPEARFLLPWELQTLLWSLGYTDELEDEGEIEDAVEVAHGDWTWRAA